MHNDNFDKWLLSAFLGVLLGLRVFLLLKHVDEQWTAHVFDNFQGALLGLITGMAMRKNAQSAPPDLPQIQKPESQPPLAK